MGPSAALNSCKYSGHIIGFDCLIYRKENTVTEITFSFVTLFLNYARLANLILCFFFCH
jgi:hypothetical protein